MTTFANTTFAPKTIVDHSTRGTAIISNVKLAVNAFADIRPAYQRQDGTMVSLSRCAANYPSNKDTVLMGTIIEAINRVCAENNYPAPNFNHMIPVTVAGYREISNLMQAQIRKGTFCSVAGDLKIYLAPSKTTGEVYLNIVLEARQFRVLAKKSEQDTKEAKVG